MAHKKKITFILPSLRGAGAERVFLNLAREFATRGYEVNLVVLKREGSFTVTDTGDVTVVDLECPRALVALPALVRYLRRERPDAIVSALPHINVLAVVASLFVRSGVRVIVTEHNPFSSDFANASFLKHFFLMAGMRFVYPRASAIVAVSKGVADDIARIVGSRASLRVIYNPVITPDITTMAREAAQHPWLDEKQGPIILSAGRLTKQKDFPTLMRAFSRIKQDTAARLIILGEGEEREALEQLALDLGIQERVSMPGFVENPYAFMARADVFVLSSLWEGFGNVLVEAMACGAPIVATRCPGGVTEVLLNGAYGALVEPGDSDTMAQRIEEAIRTPRIQGAAQRADDFSVERITDTYEEVIVPRAKVAVVTFADVGTYHNLKTPGIMPVLRAFSEREELAQVLCRRGKGSPFPNTHSGVGTFLHGIIKIPELVPGIHISTRALEEWIFDTVAALRLGRADIVVFHPEFAFPKTQKRAKKQGAVTVAIATVVHPARNERLAKEEYELVAAGVAFGRSKKQVTARAAIVGSFDYIIALSDFVKESYEAAGFATERIIVAHPDIETARFVARRKKDKAFRVLYIAHTTILKGLHYLLEAWNEAKVPGAELVIVGGYSAGTPRAVREWYDRMIGQSTSIRWVGETRNPEEFYADASMVVFPSLTEGFGRVTLEAMTAGLPVVATQNAKGIIEDGVSGFIVPIRSAQALREKIELLYNNPALLTRMGKEAARIAREKKPFGEAVYEACHTIVRREL